MAGLAGSIEKQAGGSMTQIMVTNDNSDESPLRDFGVRNGDILTAEIERRPDGLWQWSVKNWKEGVDLEVMPEECQIVGENVRPIRSHA